MLRKLTIIITIICVILIGLCLFVDSKKSKTSIIKAKISGGIDISKLTVGAKAKDFIEAEEIKKENEKNKINEKSKKMLIPKTKIIQM